MHAWIEKASAYFTNMSVVRKLLMGFLSISVIMLALGFLALAALERLNHLNSLIINEDIPRMAAIDRLREGMFAEEYYAKRHAILKSAEMRELFLRETEAFRERCGSLDLADDESRRELLSLHEDYTGILNTGVPYLASPSSREAQRFERLISDRQKKMLAEITKMDDWASSEQEERIRLISDLGKWSLYATIVLCVLGIVAAVFSIAVIARHISSSVDRLKQATMQISDGVFDGLPEVKTHDELGALSTSIIEMAGRIKRLEEMYLDASPLTHLPGGIALENILKKRIAHGGPLSFCIIDLDNFKAFNDRYGYARGNEVIRLIARCIEEAKIEAGGPEDFVGHIGGDDFALITTPDRHSAICSGIIERFDKAMPGLYDPEDRSQGYILSKTRQGEDMQFPFVSVSIGVVTNTSRKLESHIHVGEIAAELKEYAKTIGGSVFVVDHRRKDGEK